MNPEDDPEARIRQLEQQSANYGTVELGANQDSRGATPTAPLPPPVYGPPPPYGNPYTGDPYQPPQGTHFTPIRKKGAPVGLIFGLIAVTVVVLFGGIGAIVWNVVSKTTDAVSRTPGGGGSFGTPGDQPTISVPTPELPILPTMPGDGTPDGTPGGELSVAGIDKNETIACNDANVNISGVNNRINLIGHCLSVTVSGVNNRVTVASTDTIGASGLDNQVIYLSGDPEIDATGSNVVEHG